MRMKIASTGVLWIVWSCFALGCAPESISSSNGETGETGETGGESAPAPGHWLIYDVSDQPGHIAFRAVDLGGLEQGEIGPPVALLESDGEYRAEGPTPWGGWAFTLDDVFLLIGLDDDGQVEVYPGVPDGVPAEAGDPRFSADGRIALFAGPPASPPDSSYWVRYEHGHPVVGGVLAPLSHSHRVSPDAHYGAVLASGAPGELEWYQFTLDGEPGELQPLFDEGEGLSVVELFDEHLIAQPSEGFGAGQLIYVDMSSGVAGERIPIEPASVGWRTYFSPSGDIVAWLGFQDPGLGTDGQSTLWRVDIVDGVPLPGVELAGIDDVVDPGSVVFLGPGRIGWQPYTRTSVHWVDLVDGQLGPIHTVDAANPTTAAWSPDHRFVSWVDGSRRIAALAGPQAGVAHDLGHGDAIPGVVWFEDRLLYATAEPSVWMVTLEDDGPGTSTQWSAPSLDAAHGLRVSDRVLDHEAVLLSVEPQAESFTHLELLRLDANGSPETLLIDEAPQSDVVHQIVRE